MPLAGTVTPLAGAVTPLESAVMPPASAMTPLDSAVMPPAGAVMPLESGVMPLASAMMPRRPRLPRLLPEAKDRQRRRLALAAQSGGDPVALRRPPRDLFLPPRLAPPAGGPRRAPDRAGRERGCREATGARLTPRQSGSRAQGLRKTTVRHHERGLSSPRANVTYSASRSARLCRSRQAAVRRGCKG